MALWVRSNGDNGDLASVGAVVPEDTVGGRCPLFGVGFENLFTLGAFEGCKFMG